METGPTDRVQESPMRSESELKKNRAHFPVCVVDDDVALLKVTALLLESAGFPTTATSDPHVGLRDIREGLFRAALVDIKMPDLDGFAFLEKSLEIDPTVNVILVTGYYSVESATMAIKRGASDYLSKPVERDRLIGTLDELAGLAAQKRQVRELEEQILVNSEFHGVIGKSSPMLELFDHVRHVSRHRTNVLISGPPGAGKEIVGRALHAAGPCRGEAFEKFFCSAFGNTNGDEHAAAPRSNSNEAERAIEAIHTSKCSTLYFDEISDMPPAFQTKLLSLVHDQILDSHPRIVSASRRDMRQEISCGHFREDLFFRLCPIEIRVPPIADRAPDVPLLVQFFVKKYNAQYGKHFRGLTRRAQIALLKHEWPGNVRELENVIGSAVMVGSGTFVDISDLPPYIQKPVLRETAPSDNWKPSTLAEAQHEHITRVLSMAGNLTRAAEILGVSRTSLYRLQRRSSRKSGQSSN
jgi:DNA-binding NtrC family response regulator